MKIKLTKDQIDFLKTRTHRKTNLPIWITQKQLKKFKKDIEKKYEAEFKGDDDGLNI